MQLRLFYGVFKLSLTEFPENEPLYKIDPRYDSLSDSKGVLGD